MIIELFQSIVLLVTALIAYFQLKALIRSFKADHERRKKQATIEFVNKIRESYRTINNELIKKFGKGPIGTKELDALYNDYELWHKLKNMLSLFEHLAVGINTGVFDLDILDRMAGGYFINIYNRYAYYISERRKALNNNTIYSEFEGLVNKLRQKRDLLEKSGNIKYS